MNAKFLGFDHIDTRVRSLKAVEQFYDKLMPELGLPHKRYSHVDGKGDWYEPADERPYNTVEYFEDPTAGRASLFIGFIEDPSMTPTLTRIAFRTASRGDLPRWSTFLQSIGALHVEHSISDEYPALFFEDPSGTKLEICARKPGGLM